MAEQGNQRERTGIVVSDKMDKTVVIEMTMARPHPLYKKVMRRSNRVKVHDERNDARTGDKVLVRESRPLAKTKSWRLVEVLERAE